METDAIVATNENIKEESNFIQIDTPHNLYQFLGSENYDVQNICRLCMSTNNHVLYSLLSDTGDSILANMLSTLSNVQLSPQDGLPANICELCQTLLVQYYEFKIKCEKSDYILRSIIKGRLIVKDEPPNKNVILGQKEDSIDKTNGSDIKQDTEYVADIQYLEDLSDDENPHIRQDRGIKQRNIKKDDNAVNNKNMSEMNEESEDDADVQYIEDLSDDAHSEEKLHQAQDRGRKRKRKIKAVTNGHRIPQNAVLIKNSKSKKQSKGYTCSFCSKVFSRAKTFNTHLTNKHGVIIEESALPCGQCKATFDTEHDLIVHSAIHPEGTSWKCNQCHKEFNSKTTLHRHIQRHMLNKPHACGTCGKTFTELYALRRHNRVHTGERVEKKHVCHICEKRYSASSLLAAHMSRHVDLRPYECATCGKAFPSPRLLRSHMLVHSDRKPYGCSYCDKRFRHESTRNTHHRTHTGEKPYVCSVCGKTFIQNSNLTLHMRSHTGERPYSCKTCERRFTSGSSLKSHERIHTGERPYSCKVCGKTFARMNLSMHMRQHTGERPFACSTCPKKFVTASRLRDHYRIHTGEKPYECAHCTFIFTTRSHLIKHLKSHEQPKKKSAKREFVLVRRVPITRNAMKNTSSNKDCEEIENVAKDSDAVENIEKDVTIGLFEDLPLEVNREYILQDDSDLKGELLVVDNSQNNYQINNDVCLNTNVDIVNSDVNYTSDVNLVTVNEGVSISASTLEGTTVKLYQLDQSLVQIQSSSSQVTISKITSKMTTNF